MKNPFSVSLLRLLFRINLSFFNICFLCLNVLYLSLLKSLLVRYILCYISLSLYAVVNLRTNRIGDF